MTVIEFRMFFDSLPDEGGSELPSKLTFARECAIPVPMLRELATGKKRLTESYVSRVLPVMRKYGFQG